MERGLDSVSLGLLRNIQEKIFVLSAIIKDEKNYKYLEQDQRKRIEKMLSYKEKNKFYSNVQIKNMEDELNWLDKKELMQN